MYDIVKHPQKVLLRKERTHGMIIVIEQISMPIMLTAHNHYSASPSHSNTKCLSSPTAPASQNVHSVQALATPVRLPVAIDNKPKLQKRKRSKWYLRNAWDMRRLVNVGAAVQTAAHLLKKGHFARQYS